jgi:hypothetical protein
MIYPANMNTTFTRMRIIGVLLTLAGAASISGCRASASIEPPPPSVTETRITTQDGNDLQRLARRIITAQTSTDEANALQALSDYEKANNLTYQTQVVRLDTNTIVSSGSVQPYPLRVDVYIFKGQVGTYSFSFVPRDNRNLALLGL